MRKKILFVLYTMNVGGVEKSFLNFLSTFDPEHFEIDLLLLKKEGGFLTEIPNHVNVAEIELYSRYLKELSYPLHHLSFENIKNGKLVSAVVDLYIWFKGKILGSTYPLLKWVFRNEPVREKIYDVAISYASPFMFIDYYVVNKVKADHKICWIHFDISRSGIDKKAAGKIYKGFDRINIVSNDAKKIFDAVFPEFVDKTFLCYNLVNTSTIIKQAAEFNPRAIGVDRHVIATVGRVSIEKGQEMTLDVLKRLCADGYDVEWWYIGEGRQLETCKTKAEKIGVQDRAKFFGAQKNPYPYMKHCDLYVQPSVFEGFCITLAEAKIFEKPIVSTDFTGAQEQLADYKNGVVVDWNVEAMALEIEKILDSRQCVE